MSRLWPLAVVPVFALVVFAGSFASSTEGRTMFVLGILVVTVLVLVADATDPRSRAVVADAIDEVRREGLLRTAAALGVFLGLIASLSVATWIVGTAIAAHP